MDKTDKILLIVLFIAIYIFLGYMLYYTPKEKIIQPTQPNEEIKAKDSITSWVTVYHPTAKQCGNNKNITFTGDTGRIGYCAVSQYLLDYFCNFGDTIQIPKGVFKGEYIVKDKAASKRALVDIWRPVGDSLKGCYKTKLIIK